MAPKLPSKRSSGGYAKLLHQNANFRYLWLGQIVSLLGDWFDLIASASLVATLTGSSTAVGSLFVVRMLAPFLVSPFAGVAADRYNRKILLIITDILRGMVVLGFLFVRNEQTIWLLYVLTALQLGIGGFFFPTRTAILPDIVKRDELGAANALSSVTWSVMLSLGTAIGGLVSGSFGVYPAFVIDSLTFFASAYMISRIHYTHVTELSGGHAVSQVYKAYVDGLRYLRDNTDILNIALQKSWSSLIFGGGFQVIQVVLGERIFVIGKSGGIGLGILFAAAGIGTGLGPIMARIFTGDENRPLRIAIAVSYFISIAGICITAPVWGFFLVLLGITFRSFGGGMNWVFSTQLLLDLVPDRVRGRVFASEFAMFTLASAASAQATGWALDHTTLGIGGIMWIMALLGLIPTVLWMLHGINAKPASWVGKQSASSNN